MDLMAAAIDILNIATSCDHAVDQQVVGAANKYLLGHLERETPKAPADDIMQKTPRSIHDR